MSVPTTVSNATFTGIVDGVALTCPFPVENTSHLEVTYGANVVATLGVHYTVTLAPPGYASAQVTPLTGFAVISGGTINVQRNVPLVQALKIPTLAEIASARLEQAFDYLTYITTYLRDRLGRSLQFPAVDDPVINIGPLPVAAGRASKFFAFDSNGKPIASIGATSAGTPQTTFGASMAAAASASAALVLLGSSAVADTLAAAKALPVAPPAILIKGKTAIGDGWGGVFILTGAMTANDDALWVRLNIGGYSYKRLYDDGVVNVMWFGANPAASGVDPTTKTDSSPAFALADAAAPGGKCIVPAGTYWLKTSQDLTHGCYFEGVGWNERNANPAIARQGTWCYITDAAISPFTLKNTSAASSGGFGRIGFEQLHPAPIGGWAPTAYLPVITIYSTGGKCEFNDCYPYGIYDFVKASSLHGLHGRIAFGNCQGQVFHSLLDGSAILDVIYFGQIHLSAVWDGGDANVRAWQQANGVPITTQRCDGIDCTSLFVVNYLAPFKLSVEATNAPFGASTNIRFDTVYADGCKYGPWFTGTGHSAFIGTLTTQGVGVTGSQGIRDEGSGYIAVGRWNMLGCGTNAIEQSSTTGASTLHIGSLFMQEYNYDNGGSTAFKQAASTGNHVIELGVPPAVGVVTHPAAQINTNNTTNLYSISNELRANERTVAKLPAAALAGEGATSYVIDANATTAASVVAGGGVNMVSVRSDGANWRIN